MAFESDLRPIPWNKQPKNAAVDSRNRTIESDRIANRRICQSLRLLLRCVSNSNSLRLMPSKLV